MRVLGVWCKKEEIMLAVAEDGEVVPHSREKMKGSGLLEANDRLEAVRRDVVRVLEEVNPDEVRILMPEQRYEASYPQMAPRVALETVVRLACSGAGISVEMLNRASARSRVGVSKTGRLEDHIREVVSEPVGKYWNAGRNLAAIAAVADP